MADHSSFVWSSGLCGFTANSSLTEVAAGMNVPLGTLNSGAGYLFLLAGWGNLFWQPIALQYGKRPVYIISTIANLVKHHLSVSEELFSQHLYRHLRPGPRASERPASSGPIRLF